MASKAILEDILNTVRKMKIKNHQPQFYEGVSGELAKLNKGKQDLILSTFKLHMEAKSDYKEILEISRQGITRDDNLMNEKIAKRCGLAMPKLFSD